jgi:hemin uptake protein HemP
MKTLHTDSTHADGLLGDAPEPHLPSPDCIPATLLFRGRQEILIGHHGETYRLRITRNGKLILTK